MKRTNKLKALTKHILCYCGCKFDGRNVIQCKSEITINVSASAENK